MSHGNSPLASCFTGWGYLLLIFLLETSVVYSSVASDPEPEPVKDISSKEMEPVLLEVPTTSAPTPDADGSGVHTLQYVGVVSIV